MTELTPTEPKRGGISARLPRLLPPATRGELPARVRGQITRHDNESEILVRLLQLAVVAFFGALYAISPSQVSAGTFMPVPFVLAAYGVFTVGGLLLAMRYRLPDAVVYAMTFLDIALLMAMIWSFHIQYQQPPSFYLKAPTLLYIFIFIALRALRFEARFVVAAGLAAMAGWAALVAYAVMAEAGEMMVTRDYVTYLTTNSILIGAELDKTIVILSVTLILALAVRRGRALLVSAVREETAARDLSRFFDPGVAGRIRDTGETIAPGQGVERNAAILNVDIRGFTRLAERMSPDAVICALAAYQERLVPVIQRNGGTIDKFLGDGIMATFGAAGPTGHECADAMRAVDEIVAALDDRSKEIGGGSLDPASINLAVASGPVIFGAVGSDERLEFTVIGAPVNLSAKLEKHNKALGSRAIATAGCYESAIRQGYVAAREVERISEQVPGVAEPVELVRLY
ncbi:adenylate/guanylate cyclase domain-containing protein [Tepidamorphus sp. 3E244]|uniref:adenylate/guanylate cyclase domain-containing protein n=1 Tax=Tepidamorphus sp. 3E244 TaxID=3385498 RepID=UPI0038FC10DC